MPVDRPLRILVTRTDRIGDLVLSTPVFEALRGRYPDAWIACITFPENRPLVAGNPHLSEVIDYDKKGREAGLWGNLRFALRLAARRFDVAIHLHATNRMHWITWLARVPVRIGWARKCAWALTHAYPDVKKEGMMHEARYNFELLSELDVQVPAALRAGFPLEARARVSLENLLRHHGIPASGPWVVLSPGASCPSKRWVPERFARVADLLQLRYGAVPILIGATGDQPIADRVKAEARSALYDLTGRLTLGMLGWLLARARLLVSNDSGPVHIANAVGTPAISIFGRNQPGLSPVRWGPLDPASAAVWKDVGCAVCLAHRCEIGFLCLDVISVEDVMQEVARLGDRLRVHQEAAL